MSRTKTAAALKQRPWLVPESGSIQVTGAASFQLAQLNPIFLGSEILSTAVSRTLNLGVWVQPRGVFGVRVTLSAQMPVTAPGSAGGLLLVAFVGPYSQFTWTWLASGAWQFAGPVSLPIANNKNPYGMSYLTLELQGTGETRGFSQCIESRRSQ